MLLVDTFLNHRLLVCIYQHCILSSNNENDIGILSSNTENNNENDTFLNHHLLAGSVNIAYVTENNTRNNTFVNHRLSVVLHTK